MTGWTHEAEHTKHDKFETETLIQHLQFTFKFKPQVNWARVEPVRRVPLEELFEHSGRCRGHCVRMDHVQGIVEASCSYPWQRSQRY